MTAVEDLVLVPRPRRLEALGPGPAAGDVALTRVEHPSVHPQGFRLTVAEGAGVRIEHRDPAGLRYATQLLDQVRAQCPDGRLPGLRVEDHPDVPVRALLLDVSRDRVPTRATLERIVELAALARYNQLQLSIEHTYAYRDHQEVWRHASPLTAAHVDWLERLCSAHGIELVPCPSSFGHMGRWLAHERYRHRAECPDGWELRPGLRMPPSVLAPTEANAALVLSLLDELLAAFRSTWVNIGCDEPFELGRGASRAEVAARGLGPVYADHVRRLAEPLLAGGHRVQVWADVLRHHPEVARTLPEGVVPVAWCYEAPPPDGAPLDLPPAVTDVLAALGTGPDAFSGFARNVAPLAEAGVPFWVAAGTSGWSSLVGRSDNARANLVDGAEAARAHGAGGYLVTDWGDGGHPQPPSVSFGPLVLGGALAWSLDANRDLDLDAVLSRHVFGDGTGRLAAALDRLGRQWARTGQRAVNGSPLSAALFPGEPHLVVGRPDPDRVGDVVGAVEDALAEVAASAPTCADAALVRAEVTQAARMARHGAWRLLGPAGPPAAARQEDMAELVEGQLTTWLDRARPGGLADSLARLDPVLAAAVDVPDPEG